ncbi:hypothetical protein PUNSTDRAFT_50736 [Punctularia strigosozonata HHB-11173 SS5]|uniref:uncharacterized protein n=1 Tax=Punctularia strigosozonata (strain HHB-11173) TaxID=741275 RepID=UPI00044163D6|nr:uncharacterized protein PUNSTDRAFT_50736 [Punctularia strigosozonata HHB-11173 SS5]EIN11913.1 hypothetical protein PUNSTDRAFT_50736 [Punctularia strigosozonata HHB-11173 SS5]
MSPSPSFSPTLSLQDDHAVSSSEAAALHGHKAKTPMIAGIISGGAVALGWAVAFVLFLYKRQKRRKRARREGLKSHRDLEVKGLPHPEMKYIIPPDPAIVGGMRAPGDSAAGTGNTSCTSSAPSVFTGGETDKGKAPAMSIIPEKHLGAGFAAAREPIPLEGTSSSATSSSSEPGLASSTTRLPT